MTSSHGAARIPPAPLTRLGRFGVTDAEFPHYYLYRPVHVPPDGRLAERRNSLFMGTCMWSAPSRQVRPSYRVAGPFSML